MATQEEVLRSMEYLLGQLNKDLEVVRVKIEDFSKTNITELTTEQFYAEINKDLTAILDNMKVYDNIVQEYKNNINTKV